MDTHPQPATPTRLGPRPLGLHLTIAATTWASCIAGWPSWRRGSLPWKQELAPAANELRKSFETVSPEAGEAAIRREIFCRLDELERGLRAYRHHPYHRSVPAPPAIWQAGTTRLLDFGSTPEPGLPVLVIPSLINRYYIMDLSLERSFLRYLSGQGLRPFVLDWDRPGEAERHFDVSGYMAERLEPALDLVRARTGTKPAVLGYCMGGTLAAALAALRAPDIAALVLLATPWDFHAETPELGLTAANLSELWLPFVETYGELPVDGLQALFATLDPFLVVRKFCALARLRPDSDAAREFVALEDWLNDGVPLAAPVARECLVGWYGRNDPGRGAWQVRGRAIDPGAIAVPTLVVVPEHDRIVPPTSAGALASGIPWARRLDPPAGHIGMMSGSRAAATCHAPIAVWLASHLSLGQYTAPTRSA